MPLIEPVGPGRAADEREVRSGNRGVPHARKAVTDTTSTAPQGFGPSALATPANALTVARLMATPLFVALIVVKGASWWTVAVGVLVAGSDGIDGWLARRQGATSSGAFLDPLADKAIVLGGFVTLAALGHLPWLPVALIAARELGMSAYRSWAARRGVSIPARASAKVKTWVQDLAIATCLVPPLANEHTLQLVAVWIATALTLLTGVQYLLDGRRALNQAGA
jgi:CDP-diacylglycerol---glycerol-3-phosphate 3-phosphatidyltransferase